MSERDIDVIVVGAGPVGLTLTIDLGRRGVRCLLIEREPEAPWPKMDRSNARTMEIYRRLGIADRRARARVPRRQPDGHRPGEDDERTRSRGADVPVGGRTARADRGLLGRQPAAGALPAGLAEHHRTLASRRGGDETPNTTIRYGHELVDFEQDHDGVSVRAHAWTGGETFRALPRRLRRRLQHGTEEAGDQAPGPSRDPRDPAGDLPLRRHVRAHGDHRRGGTTTSSAATTAWSSTVTARRCRTARRCPRTPTSRPTSAPSSASTALQILPVNSWRPHLLVADSYRAGRVFLAGDAAHLVIPTGGLGMNTGIGDAIDLSWKLAGVVNGWGGDGLLDGYELERRRREAERRGLGMGDGRRADLRSL